MKYGFLFGAGAVLRNWGQTVRPAKGRKLSGSDPMKSFEWDDMIHNGLGCMTGCIIMNYITEIIRKR